MPPCFINSYFRFLRSCFFCYRFLSVLHVHVNTIYTYVGFPLAHASSLDMSTPNVQTRFLFSSDAASALHQQLCGGGCTNVMHGRSSITIDPRIPTTPGRRTSGFLQPDRHCLRPCEGRGRAGGGGVRLIPESNNLQFVLNSILQK